MIIFFLVNCENQEALWYNGALCNSFVTSNPCLYNLKTTVVTKNFFCEIYLKLYRLIKEDV